MRIDLHVHSSASDGVFSPAEVVRKAHANGVEVMALTDHDTVSGLKEARKEAEKLGMRFIDGVELSVSWGGRTIHVVSLGPKKFEPYRELSEKLSKQRDLRARTIASKFDAMGIYNTYEQALELAGNGLNLSRRHFALALVQRGTVGTEDEAFEKYLRDEGPAFVKTQWMTLPEAMRFIRETEGVAVVAHPGRYNFAAPLTTIDLLEEFKALGGDAIEVTTGSNVEAENERYTRAALSMGVSARSGRDFQGCKSVGPEPGLQEPLPDYLPTVLDLLKDR